MQVASNNIKPLGESTNTIRWSDNTISLLIENLQTREILGTSTQNVTKTETLEKLITKKETQVSGIVIDLAVTNGVEWRSNFNIKKYGDK